ncbi:MAG: transposase [Pseudomonadota bacterium]|nr:transposase [Pseudomonadota bacterium]
MPNYRRAHEGGATYFFTVVAYQRQRILLQPNVLDALRDAFRNVRQTKPFKLDAVVILPDHLHAIWTLPPGDAGFGARWGMIKRHVSKTVGASGAEATTHSMKTRRELGFWQRRFWEHLIRDDDDYARHMDYIHFNPVKHGYVKSPADWQHSSFRKSVAQGIYPVGWASGANIEGDFGE